MATSLRTNRILGVPGCECRLPLPLPVRSSSCAASIARRPVTTEPSDETQSESSVMTAAATLASPFVQAADRKSTRLNSSHGYISYAVFCLKKKKNENHQQEHVHYM